MVSVVQIFRQGKQGWFVSLHSLGPQLKDLESSEVLTEAGRSACKMAHSSGWQTGWFLSLWTLHGLASLQGDLSVPTTWCLASMRTSDSEIDRTREKLCFSWHSLRSHLATLEPHSLLRKGDTQSSPHSRGEELRSVKWKKKYQRLKNIFENHHTLLLKFLHELCPSVADLLNVRIQGSFLHPLPSDTTRSLPSQKTLKSKEPDFFP